MGEPEVKMRFWICDLLQKFLHAHIKILNLDSLIFQKLTIIIKNLKFSERSLGTMVEFKERRK